MLELRFIEAEGGVAFIFGGDADDFLAIEEPIEGIDHEVTGEAFGESVGFASEDFGIAEDHEAGGFDLDARIFDAPFFDGHGEVKGTEVIIFGVEESLVIIGEQIGFAPKTSDGFEKRDEAQISGRFFGFVELEGLGGAEEAFGISLEILGDFGAAVDHDKAGIFDRALGDFGVAVFVFAEKICEADHPIFLGNNALFIEPSGEARGSSEGVEKGEDAAMFFPKGREQFHFELGEIVFGTADDDGPGVFGDEGRIEEIEGLGLDILAFEIFLEDLEVGAFDFGFSVTADQVDFVWSAFGEFEEGGGDGLFSFEGFDFRLGLARHHRGLVGRFEGDHIGGVDEFASLIAVENEDIFVGPELILGLEFLGAAEAPIGVDVFGGEFLFGGELILTHQGLEIGDDLAGVGKEDDRSHGFFEVSEEIFGLGTEGEFLIPRIVPSFEVTEAKVVEHQDDAGDEGDLEEDIEPDLEAMNFHGLSRGIWSWRSHGRWGRG